MKMAKKKSTKNNNQSNQPIPIDLLDEMYVWLNRHRYMFEVEFEKQQGRNDIWIVTLKNKKNTIHIKFSVDNYYKELEKAQKPNDMAFWDKVEEIAAKVVARAI